ncbi:MAG: hypothetical protein ACYDHH_18805 [Solirubrobacteraceae bacterium]
MLIAPDNCRQQVCHCDDQLTNGRNEIRRAASLASAADRDVDASNRNVDVVVSSIEILRRFGAQPLQLKPLQDFGALLEPLRQPGLRELTHSQILLVAADVAV